MLKYKYSNVSVKKKVFVEVFDNASQRTDIWTGYIHFTSQRMGEDDNLFEKDNIFKLMQMVK